MSTVWRDDEFRRWAEHALDTSLQWFARDQKCDMSIPSERLAAVRDFSGWVIEYLSKHRPEVA